MRRVDGEKLPGPIGMRAHPKELSAHFVIEHFYLALCSRCDPKIPMTRGSHGTGNR